MIDYFFSFRGEQTHKYQMKKNQETILDYDKFTQPF